MTTEVRPNPVEPSRVEPRRTLIGQAALLAGAQYVAAGLSLVTAVISARLLGPENYGAAALVMSYPALLWSIVNLKPVTATTRFLANLRATGRHDEIRNICKLGYALDAGASMIVFALIAASAWFVTSQIYELPGMTWLVITFAASLPLSSLASTSSAVLQSTHRFGWLASFSVLDRVVALTAVLGFLLAGLGVTGMVLGVALAQAISGLAQMIVATRALAHDGTGFWWTGSLSQSKDMRQELLRFLGWTYVWSTIDGLLLHVPLILLRRLSGLEAAGYFRLTTTLITTAGYLETSLGKVVYPRLCALWSAGSRAELRAELRRWTLHAGVPAALTVVLAALLMPYAIPLAFGASYEFVTSGVQILLGVLALNTMFFWLNSYYYASGQVGYLIRMHCVYGVAVLGLSWWVIEMWGFLGIVALIAAGKVLLAVFLTGSVIAQRLGSASATV